MLRARGRLSAWCPVTSKPVRLRARRIMQTYCLSIYTSHSRLDNTPFHHLCELPPRHTSWHLCWCGCAFTERGVVGYQQKLDLGLENIAEATHEPL